MFSLFGLLATTIGAPRASLASDMGFGRLGLVLLHERFKTGSAWETYIQNLPSTFTGAPLSSFGAVEMRALQDRDLAAQIDKR